MHIPKAFHNPFLALFFVTLLVCVSPSFITAPYLISEEGSVYFQYAWTHGFWRGVITPQLGYLSLWGNVSVASATLLPVEYVPWVTTLFGVACLGILLFLATRSWGVLTHLSSRALFIALVLFIPTGHGKLFANFTHFYWSLIAVLIATSTPNTRKDQILCVALMLVAGLSSPSASFVLPALLWRAWKDFRNCLSIALCLVLALSMVIQASITLFDLSAVYPDHYKDARLQGGWLGLISVSIYAKFLASILGGPWLSEIIGKHLSNFLYQYPSGRVMAIFSLVIIVLPWINKGFRSLHRNTDLKTGVLLLSFVSMLVGNIVTGMSHGGPRFHLGVGELRYYYVPGIIFGLLLLNAIQYSDKWHSGLAKFCLVWIIASGITQYIFQYRPQYVWLSEGPVWVDEIQNWKNNPDYVISIRPHPHKLRLSAHEQETSR